MFIPVHPWLNPLPRTVPPYYRAATNIMPLQRLSKLRATAKQRVGSLWYYSALQFLFMKIGDVINLIVGVFLVPAFISSDDLGAIVPFRMILLLAAMPMAVLTRVAVKFVNAFHVDEARGQVKALLRDLAAVAAILSITTLIGMWLGREFLQARLKIDDVRILYVLTVSIVLALWMPVLGAATQGLMRFRHIILSGVVRPVVYLVLILLLLRSWQLLGYLAATLGGVLAVILYQAWSVRGYLSPSIRAERYSAHWGAIRKYTWNVGSVTLLMGLGMLVEPWVIRHFAARVDSAGYYMAFTFGQIPLYISGAFVPFLFPLISAKHEKGERTEHMLKQSMLAVLLVGVPLTIAFAFGGRWLLELRGAWRQYADYSPYLWRIGIVSTLQGMILAFMQHENACYRFRYIKGFVAVYAIEIVLLYCLMGWTVFRPWLPVEIWEAVQSVVRHKLAFAVWMMLGTRVVLAGIALRSRGRAEG